MLTDINNIYTYQFRLLYYLLSEVTRNATPQMAAWGFTRKPYYAALVYIDECT
jgi:hypothetical protein